LTDSKWISETDIRRLASVLESQPLWELNESIEPRSDALARAIDRLDEGSGTGGELYFRHVLTDGTLYVQLPGPSHDTVIDGVVEQPIEQSNSRCEHSALLAGVNDVQQAIAQRFTTPYLSVGEGPTTILQITVPHNYSVEQVDTALSRAGTASVAIHQFYCDVWRLLGQRSRPE